MKKRYSLPIYVFNIFILLFIIFSLNDIAGQHLFRVLGLSGLSLTYLLFAVTGKEISKVDKLFSLSTGLILFTLFCKYYFWKFWDIPALIILPMFLVLVGFWIRETKEWSIHFITVCLVVMSSIPLFMRSYHDDVRQFIPVRWYDRYHDVASGTVITLKDDFNSKESRILAEEAHELKINNQYDEAKVKYEQALKIDSLSTNILFELSHCYAHENKLEDAVKLLSMAISIDSNECFISQRGLFYYKIGDNELAKNDFKVAVDMNNEVWHYHTNLGLVYHSIGDFELSCKEMSIGYEMMKFPEKENEVEKRIRKRVCK